MRPFDGNNYNSSRERKRPSVFQGDGLDAFIDIYCSRDGSRSSGTPECLLPPSPMERYYRDEEVPWELGGTMDGTVAKDPREEREDGERERRLSYVVEDALKVFSGTNEASAQPPNSKSPATIEVVVKHGNTIPTSEPQESLFHDLMVLSQVERKKKMFTKGAVYTHVRQRKSARKEDDALAVEELGEVDRRGEKRKRSGSFSVSDEEEKRVKVVKLRDRCVS
ncbi:hypothetical protein VF21_08777 [Pseudogymnoascus sp. 05NY08]|nr:hypothetical protein VF21_08777 [Pseudogymnoascus sp. 05NY08]